ncbi:hypothetical protein Cgig2_027679 [Carnegiea gigantea]|uniref:cytochrome-c oxidase n=1 Tax=Carnegiea gigantea TaxID=171969 RepID=A0A9Q1Q4I2_9CARY|nr:hypothetical protein Cgig2_027679 [Carnegiea gigantea]
MEIIHNISLSIILMFIAIPSFALSHSMDEVEVDLTIITKAIGHQHIGYSNYNTSDEQSLIFDNYTIPKDDPKLGQSCLSEVDNRVVVPVKTHICIIVMSANVLHSWVVPSSVVKCDRVPGHLKLTSKPTIGQPHHWWCKLPKRGQFKIVLILYKDNRHSFFELFQLLHDFGRGSFSWKKKDLQWLQLPLLLPIAVCYESGKPGILNSFLLEQTHSWSYEAFLIGKKGRFGIKFPTFLLLRGKKEPDLQVPGLT